MTTDTIPDAHQQIAAANAKAVCQLLGLTQLGDSVYGYMEQADWCGNCGGRQTRFYNTALGIPVCGPCRPVVAS